MPFVPVARFGMAGGTTPLRIVSVAGSSEATATERSFALELGRLLAEAGYAVACGGGPGVMEAACEGACSVGGLTIGMLQGVESAQANRFVRISLPTDLGSARNRLVALAGFSLVAIGGKYGTLSEVAFALDAGRPVCATGTWSSIPGVTEVGTPEEALQFVRKAEEVLSC